jgi:hypothetical protein
MINLEYPVKYTNLRVDKNTDPWINQRWDQVPRRKVDKTQTLSYTRGGIRCLEGK